MDDKANLRQLSNCLNQASSLINTILAAEERPDPPFTPRQLNQRQPEQRRPESVSPALSSEASTSASTSHHVNVVASAVNRARLMIQQSSSKGLYSRLGKKERLRATIFAKILWDNLDFLKRHTDLSLHFLTYFLPPPSPHPFQCCADVRRRLVSEVLLFCYSNIERGARGELII